MKSNIFLVFLLCISFSSYAQLDSLQKAYENSKHDSVSALTLARIGRYFETVDFDSALHYYNKALNISRKTSMKHYPVYEGRVAESIGFAYIYSQQKVKEGIGWMRKALEIHKASSNKEEELKTAYNIAFMFSQTNSYDSAIAYYQYIIQQNTDLKSSVRLHESYNNIGLNYYYQAKYKEASYYLLEGIRMKEALGETKEIAASYMNLGLVFQNLDEHERAKKYFQKTEKELLRLDNKYGIALSIKNYADCLLAQDSLDLATKKYEESLALYEEIGHRYGIAEHYQNMARVAQKRKQYQKSYDYLLISEEKLPKNAGDRSKVALYNSIARTQILLLDSMRTTNGIDGRKWLMSTVDYAEKAWKYAAGLGDQDDLLAAATTLSDAYERLGKYPKALFYAKERARLSEEVNAKAKTAAMSEMLTKYETEKAEAENTLLKQQEIANYAKLRQQQLFTIAGIGVAGLLAILAYIVYRSREQARISQAIAEKALSENELLLKEIHHRVKNNLQIVSSLLNLQTKQTEDKSALSAMEEGQNRVQAMALIHQGMYQNTDMASINFRDYAQQLLERLSDIYPKSKDVQMEVIGENITLDIDTAVPLGLILNELITNAFKYAFEDMEKGELKVELSQLENKQYQLIVHDNGQGVPEEVNPQKSRSIGLKLIKGLAKQLYGNLDYKYENGAKFLVSFRDTELRKQTA